MKKQEVKNLDSFIFYRSWYDTFKDFDTPEEQAKFIDCILSYALNGEVIHKENKNVQRSAKLIYPLIDSSQAKRAKQTLNASKGGRSKTISEEQLQQANELHEQGFTWKLAADAIGVSDRTLYRYIEETDKTDKTDKTDITQDLSLTKLTELTKPLCIMSYENDNVNENVYDDVNVNENDDVDVYAEKSSESNIMPIGSPLKEKDYITDIVDFISTISKYDDIKHIKSSLAKKINSEDISAETFFNELKDNHSYLSDYCENSANKKDNVYYIINVTAKRIMNSKNKHTNNKTHKTN